MENANAFVQAKLQLLSQTEAPAETNADQSWIHFQQTKRCRQTKQLFLSLTASLILLASLLPQPRAWAQQAWTSYILGNTTNISFDIALLSPELMLPNVFPLSPPDAAKSIKVSSLSEAGAAANFPVYTLQASLGQPTYTVVESPTLEKTLHKKVIDHELRRLNREPVQWPEGLDGGTIKLILGKTVLTRFGQCPTIVGPWNSCAMLAQSRPAELHISAPIALAALTVFSLELAGLGRVRAQSFAKLGSTFFLPFDNDCKLQQTKVNNSPAILTLYPKAPNGEEAFNLQWQERGFSFSLFGRDPSRAIALAESLH
jgi:hypothetical protein